MKTCCRCGGVNHVSDHEPLMGKNRSLSIKYKLQVPLCFACHRLAHDEPSQEFNRQLQIQMQIKFELENSDKSFLFTFGRNYLD